jgi:flagellar biogenesis protein FliO
MNAAMAEAAAALVAVLAMIVLAGRVARGRLGAAGGSPALRLRATLALDTRRRLHLVETDGGAVLVLTGGTGDQILPWPAQGRSH